MAAVRSRAGSVFHGLARPADYRPQGEKRQVLDDPHRCVLFGRAARCREEPGLTLLI